MFIKKKFFFTSLVILHIFNDECNDEMSFLIHDEQKFWSENKIIFIFKTREIYFLNVAHISFSLSDS